LSLRLATAAVTVTRSWSENVERASDTDVTAASGCVGRAANHHRRHDAAGRQTRSFLAAPAVALEIADQDDLAPRQRRLRRMLPATFSAGP
jgi:hypothetical protein